MPAIEQKSRTKWDVVYHFARQKWVTIPLFALILAVILSAFALLFAGHFNCSIINGTLSCSRTSSIFIERYNTILIADKSTTCKRIVAIPPFRSSAINYGGITDMAYQLAFADIFSVALGSRYQTLMIAPYADESNRQTREELLDKLARKDAISYSRTQLEEFKGVPPEDMGILLGHIYVLEKERRDTGQPATVLLTLRLVGIDDNELWQAAHLISMESLPATVSTSEDTGGVGGFEAAFVLAQDFASKLNEKIPCARTKR